ncbi:MAG: iron ABC transporter permease [Pseudomonadota bacterium]
MRRPTGTQALAALIALTALAPIAVLIDLAGSAEQLFRARQLTLLANTLLLMGLTMLGAVLIGVPLALLTAYGRFPLRALWLVLLAAPLAMPSYLGAFAFFAAFGPGGEVEQVLGLATPSATGMGAAALVMALYTYPFVLLTTRASLLSQDASLVNAARVLGLSLGAALWRVALPRALPGMAAGALLAGLYALSDFGTPAIMGVDALTRVIYVEYNAFGLGEAAVLSLQLLVLVGLVLLLESRFRSIEDRPGRPLVIWLKPWQTGLCLTACLPVVALALVLPLALFTLWLLREGTDAFDPALAWNSMQASLLAAGAAVLVALPVALAAAQGALGRLLERITYLGYGIPGIVMGTALVYLGLKLPPLYQTLTILVLAYVLRFMPLAVGAIRTSTDRLDSSVMNAARLLGAKPAEVFRRITLPLAMRGIIAGAALVFLESMRELPATLLLAPTGFETLATYLWRVYEAGYFGRAAIPGLMLILLSALGLGMMLLGERKAELGFVEQRPVSETG